MNRFLVGSLLVALFLCASVSFADTFGSGANSFSIEFVKVGNPGNPPDANPNPAGSVAYEYRIGTYEISEQMIDKANAESALAGSPLNITKDTRGPGYPATNITWYEAARFVNWLNTSTGSAAAYKFDDSGNFQLWTPSDPGYDASNLYRNGLAKYFLPSVHEWHKAAYYNPSTGTYFTYPTGSNNTPDGINFPGDPNFDAVFYDGATNGSPNVVTSVGLLSPYSTVGQGGNVREWLETQGNWRNDSTAEQHIIAGGGWGDSASVLANWNSTTAALNDQTIVLGFRIGSTIPEPHIAQLLLLGVYLIGVNGVRHSRSIANRDC